MGVAAVVFDLDGTLLDSLTDIAKAANTILESHAFPTHPESAYRYFVGDGIRRLVARAIPAAHRRDSALIEQLIAEFIELYQVTWNVHSRLYDEVPAMLSGISDRGLATAVLSNKPQEATRRCVDYYLSDYRFAAVLGQQANRPPKPDLTGVREIVELMQVAPQDCLYLGDTAVDMQTAQGASMFPVGASWGFREIAELRQAGALAIIDHPLQLLEIIDQRFRL